MMRLIDYIICFLFVAGMALGGSDGPWFPWVNLVGAGMIGVAGLMGSRLPHDDAGVVDVV